MIRDNYALVEFFDIRNFSAGFERLKWQVWGELNAMQTNNTEKLEIQQIFEIEGDALGSVMGYWCENHVDKQRFFSYALWEWQSDQEERLEDGDIDELELLPFNLSDVKHRYYRYPYDHELEDGRFDSELEFVFFDEPGDGVTAITYVEF